MLLRAMHAASPRAKSHLRIINIGSVPANSVMSVLFGHEPNAFPGAFDRQIGAFQQFDGGTLVLDQIDRLDAAMQERLLDTLKTGIVRTAGASYCLKVDKIGRAPWRESVGQYG